jgi:hypothetical protein
LTRKRVRGKSPLQANFRGVSYHCNRLAGGVNEKAAPSTLQVKARDMQSRASTLAVNPGQPAKKHATPALLVPIPNLRKRQHLPQAQAISAMLRTSAEQQRFLDVGRQIQETDDC